MGPPTPAQKTSENPSPGEQAEANDEDFEEEEEEEAFKMVGIVNCYIPLLFIQLCKVIFHQLTVFFKDG